MLTKENLTMMSFTLMRDGRDGKIDADTVVRSAYDNGLRSMDMMLYEFQVFGEKALREALNKYGVHCGCLITSLSFYKASEEEIRMEAVHALEFAKSLSADMLMVVPGSYDEEEKKILRKMGREEMMDKAISGYRIAVDAAKPFGITVSFENTPQDLKPLASPEDCEYLLSQVPGLGFVFDTANFLVADGNCDVLDAYEKLKKYVVRIHLKDVVKGPFDSGERCTDGEMIRAVSTGSGIIPIHTFIRKLAAEGYNGMLAVEYAAPETLHGEEHIAMAGVYVDYITGSLTGAPMQTKYGRIEGLDKPVSRMFFGTANARCAYGKDASDLLDAAMTYGINAFDTARGYGLAENSLGRWIKERNNRERVVILSKCGNISPDGSVHVTREVIEKELEESLAALQTDYIDIYLLHRDDPKTPVSELIDTLNEAQAAGKIRIFGVSNWTVRRIKEANAYAKENGLNGFSISSPNFGLAEQIADPWGGGCVTLTGENAAPEREWYRKTQMPVIAYSSLARGLMGGKIRSCEEKDADKILDPFCVKGYVSHENFIRLARCEELAEKKGCTVAQIAVAWMFTQGLNVYAIASTTKVKRIPENLKALCVDITEEEGEWLNLRR